LTSAKAPLRLRLDGAALAANWRWCESRGAGAECGAAVKADGYGLGATEVVRRLAEAGCRTFYVATWAEAEALGDATVGLSFAVLHGVGRDDVSATLASSARPVLNTLAQVARWREIGGGRPCDVMVDTGINRLGVAPTEIGAGIAEGLNVDTLMSHLACGESAGGMNERQRKALEALRGSTSAKRLSLANSAGICLGPAFAFDLTRPGLALYGGVPRAEAEGAIRQVVRVEARVVQRRRIEAGESVGYGATFTAEEATELAILNIGYADGYLHGFSGKGRALVGGKEAPVVGRVSMDLTAIRANAVPELAEGDWVELQYDLPRAAAVSGLSQYELLTTLGQRFERIRD